MYTFFRLIANLSPRKGVVISNWEHILVRMGKEFMKRFFFIFFVVLIFCAKLTSDAHANDNTLIAKCVASYDFGQLNNMSVTVKPIIPACANMCENQCNSLFSRKVAINNGRLIELNQGIIYDCIAACQLGRPYQSFYNEGVTKLDGSYEEVVRSEARNDATCSSFYPSQDLQSISKVNYTEAKVFAGKPFKLQLLRGLDNKVYQCGRKSVRLKPLINSPDPAVWNKGGLPSAEEATKRAESNLCYRTQYPYDFNTRSIVPTQLIDPNTASNVSLWSGLDVEKGKNPCFWSARNSYFTDTGIRLKDGDELSLSYQGDFPWFTIPNLSYNSRKDLFDLYQSQPSKKNEIVKAWINSSMIAIMRPGSTDYAAPVDLTVPFFTGEDARIIKSGYDNISTLNQDMTPEELNNPPASATQLGLKGKTLDNFKAVTIITTGSDCDSEEKRNANPVKCRKIVDPGLGGYTFSGNVSGFSTVRQPFAIKHLDWTFDDNTGGFDVQIDWGGCTKVNGQDLQYTILTERADGNYLSTTINEGDWRDYPENGFDATFAGINAYKSGVLAFRIKDPAITNSQAFNNNVFEVFQGYRMGEYNFVVDAYDESQVFVVVKFLRDYTKIIRDTLFGDRTVKNGVVNEGVVMLLYNNIIRDGSLYAITYSMLVLFIALTGLGFIIGTVELNQKEVVSRTLKFAAVATITSPMSWRFFADNFLYAFIDGGLTLISLIATAGLGNLPVNIEADPINALYLFDVPLKMMFSGATWIKIYALLFVNIMGIVMVIIICFSAAMYFIAVLKAVAILMFSMIGIAVLVIMAPIFISMVLFQFTREFFDRWWKYMLSFTLQPVAVFVMICIFNIMITIAIKTMLGFTACPYCFFKIKLPNVEGLNSYFIDWCFFEAYAPFTSAFYEQAPEFELPNRMIEGMLFFVILAFGMYELTSMISSVINRIVTGMVTNTFDLGSYANTAQSTIIGGGKDLVEGAKSKVESLKKTGEKLKNIASRKSNDGKDNKEDSPKSS